MKRQMKQKGYSVKHYNIIPLTAVLMAMCLVFPYLSHAQKVTADTTRFLIGSKVGVTIEIEFKPGTLLEWPVLGDTLTHSIEIIEKNKPDTIQREGNDNILVRQLISITSFDTGFQVLPPLTFKLTRKGSTSPEVLSSKPLMFEVMNVQVDLKADIKDIKAPFKAPYTFRDFLPWLLLALAVGLLGVLAWYYIRNRRLHKPLIKLPERAHKPPHVIAIEELEVLKNEQVWQKGQVKEYYTRLTDILRAYFEARYGVPAAEMTSDEILSSVKDDIQDAAIMSDLKKILFLSDMAKFAKAQPIGAENELSLTYARTVVVNTAPAAGNGKETNTVNGNNPESGTKVIA